uniref:Uncharacterized protein n=1 Tax=Nelumbo nucifera TaxID=4432 RepID=A0A822XM99_NELNU|nr:TPA_asm: hypothetical protein HUJ06_022943 [Nelumbo nucifera]
MFVLFRMSQCERQSDANTFQKVSCKSLGLIKGRRFQYHSIRI